MANRSASELDSVTDRVEEKELDAGKVKEAMSSLVANDVADRAEEKARCVVVPPRRSVLPLPHPPARAAVSCTVLTLRSICA